MLLILYTLLSLPALAAPAPKTVSIPITAPMPLNGVSKKDVYTLRTLQAGKYPQFTGGGAYQPSEEVFGQITDGKPWWGLLGRSYYGPGQNAIQGDAEESRWIANPLLLVGLDSGHALIGNGPKPVAVYPVPSNLLWQADGKLAMVEYNVGSFMRASALIGDDAAAGGQLGLVAYNARDLGYAFFYIDPGLSQGVTGADHFAPIMQFIHTGRSCGYPGGCNNMSPEQAEMRITVTSLPAAAYIKLWKHVPPDADAPEDMAFVIKMK